MCRVLRVLVRKKEKASSHNKEVSLPDLMYESCDSSVEFYQAQAL
jgi:hypothetical protein